MTRAGPRTWIARIPSRRKSLLENGWTQMESHTITEKTMTLMRRILQTAMTDDSTSVEDRNVACVVRTRILEVWTGELEAVLL
jgi:hypothetical protein